MLLDIPLLFGIDDSLNRFTKPAMVFIKFQRATGVADHAGPIVRIWLVLLSPNANFFVVFFNAQQCSTGKTAPVSAEMVLCKIFILSNSNHHLLSAK